MSSNADAQTDKTQVKGIHTFKPTTTNGYRKGSVLRQKGVGETKETNGVGLHRGDDDEHDVTCSDVIGERSDEQLGRDKVIS